MSEKIQDDDIDSDNEFQYADILAREPTSLVHVDKSNNNNNDNYYNDNEEEEEEGGGGEDDDQPLLEGEYGSERSLNNDNNSSKDIELRIPVRLQRMKASAKKKQVIHKPYFTIFISVVDVLMMIIEIIINKGFVSFKKNPWIGVSLDTLIMMGGKDTGLITATTPQLWRLLTPVFLHVGLGHLALNLLAQLLLGFQLEKTLGSVRVIIIYFVSAIAGNLMSAVFLPYQLEVGASTAIYGLGSYYLVDLMVHWSLIIAPMRYFVGLMIGSVVGLLFGLLPGIDNFAHIGGSAGGFLISLLLVPRTKEGKSLKYAKIAFYLGPPLLLSYFALGFVILFTPLRWAVWNCHWCEYMNCLPVFHWCSS